MTAAELIAQLSILRPSRSIQILAGEDLIDIGAVTVVGFRRAAVIVPHNPLRADTIPTEGARPNQLITSLSVGVGAIIGEPRSTVAARASYIGRKTGRVFSTRYVDERLTHVVRVS